ncbi:TetR/AcrR family transcriptional regulator [Pedomonas mirosovicensis]|uniref:TetR/AcrR family transcriptional regulator n=1 Tax=Pedomonas mirosovicensis TaxID=2908641 RepID=UPI00216818D8|nr:TetR/AcrR family transcriptional regulator [Pedomonas mirosovicensis]MCH8684418.1 TetR/AcrR family transcriptional regulator [Pedomonas mirosovicensis]
MQEKTTPKATRRPRSDGERNRIRLIEAAKRAFAEKGPSVGLEHIARDAGVSIASLYRHFPTRDDLISEVYQQEVTALIEAADELMSKQEPVAALREWLMMFVEFLDAKHGMAAAMDTLLGGPEPIYSKTPHRLDVPVKALVSRGVAAGVFRSDIEPHDLLRALSGVAHVRPGKNWKQQAVRMVDLLLDGLQRV